MRTPAYKTLFWNIVIGAIGPLLLVPAISTATNGDNPASEIRAEFDSAVEGKTVAWVPVTLGNHLGDSWTKAMRENFDKQGINFVVRDPSFDSDAQLQAVTALINDGPDVLIVQNPNVSLLSRQLRRAMEQGIYVIQVNMSSNQVTDAYVGVDNYESGRIIAEEIVQECGGGNGSGKVALVQGESTAAASLDQLRGAMAVFDADDTIEVVSSQAANWDSGRAYDITSTVLQQHPDLCATYGFWGTMQQGAAQAVRSAGLEGEVKVYASSEGNWTDCDMVENGLFHKILSFRSDVQGQQISDAVLTLLQEDAAPGERNLSYFSNNFWVTGEEDRNYCFEESATK